MMADWNDLFNNRELLVQEPNSNLVNYFETLRKTQPIRSIIDLGCGTGRHALFFAGQGYDVHAVDSSPNALEILRNKAEPFANIRISQMDLRNLSAIREKYDFAVCVNVLSHGTFREIARMFAEIERIVQDNGFLFLIIAPVGYCRYVQGPDTIEVEKNSFLHINAPDGDILHHFFTEEEVRFLLKNFREVTVKNVMEYSPWQKKEVEHMLVTARR